MLERCSFCARLVTGLVSKLVGKNLVAVKERAQEKVERVDRAVGEGLEPSLGSVLNPCPVTNLQPGAAALQAFESS